MCLPLQKDLAGKGVYFARKFEARVNQNIVNQVESNMLHIDSGRLWAALCAGVVLCKSSHTLPTRSLRRPQQGPVLGKCL